MSAGKNFWMLALASFVWLSSPNLGISQELQRYQPSRPTVSPYLSLGRVNAGGLPNYYALVRPQNQQRQLNLQGQRLQRQQAIAVQQLQQPAIQQRPIVPQRVITPSATGTGSRFLTGGSRSRYRDTLQFYPAVSLR